MIVDNRGHSIAAVQYYDKVSISIRENDKLSAVVLTREQAHEFIEQLQGELRLIRKDASP